MMFSVIVPTLNEARYLPRLLGSLRAQTNRDFQLVVVDGGSTDPTTTIARSFGAKVFTLNGASEFEARNFGAKHSEGSLLVFTCADVVFPKESLEKVGALVKRRGMIAISGPDIPFDGDASLKVIYSAYNAFRLASSRLPYPLKAFSTSTNFLVVDRITFDRSGGFRTNDVNADGILGRYLADHHKILFDNRVAVYVSARRASSWGLRRFLRHYLYVLENFFPSISKHAWFQKLKTTAERSHGQIHSGNGPQ